MSILQKIKRLAKQIRGLLPSELPNGLAAFNAWAEDIADTYTLPTSDLDSVKFTLATIIMHLDQNASHRPKYYFVKILKASASKQVAHAAFSAIKEAQQAKVTAASEAELREPTKS